METIFYCTLSLFSLDSCFPPFIHHKTLFHLSQDLHSLFYSLGPGSAVGQRGKNIGKQSELSRSLGRGKGALSPLLVHHLTSCFTLFLPLSLTMISGLRQYFNGNDLQLVKGTFNFK